MATMKTAQTGSKVVKKKTLTNPKLKNSNLPAKFPKEKEGNPYDRNYPTTDRMMSAQNGKKVVAPKKTVAPKKSNINTALPGFVAPSDPKKVKLMDYMSKNGSSIKKKMKNGGSLTGLKASDKRVGPVDPKGAFTKVQKKTLAGARGKASLTKDKQLGATKMSKK